jgi:protein-S-isoprenylcysteine O-methyltransferase Ste14
MYVGVITAILGWVVLYQTTALLLYAIAVWINFQLFVLLYEEPHLQRKFGGEYDEYRSRVGRWLPRFGKHFLS